jgi:hypothetical protein
MMNFRSTYVQGVRATRYSNELLESLIWAGNMLGIYPERQPLHGYTRLDMSLTRDVQIVPYVKMHFSFYQVDDELSNMVYKRQYIQ